MSHELLQGRGGEVAVGTKNGKEYNEEISGLFLCLITYYITMHDTSIPKLASHIKVMYSIR